jgi:hypothetical protein
VREARVREAIALAHALDAALASRGHNRPRSSSPLAFAEDLVRQGSPLGPVARKVAARYMAARFGDEALAPDEFDGLRRALRDAPNPLA